MDLLVSFVESVLAGIVVYFISKWLDRFLNGKK